MKKYDVAIIGAGTAGMTARREVANKTDNYIVIDDGPLGTTCARVGCMPSKVLIQVANDFDRRKKFQQMGIEGTESLSLNGEAVMEHVRSLRDRFVRAVKSPMESWQDKLLRGRAEFLDPHRLKVGDQEIVADKIIIAAGSRPVLPTAWNVYSDHLLNTDQIFEMKTLPKTMAVIGLGVIGIELGQALARLGVRVVGITSNRALGGATDPKLQDYLVDKFSKEFDLHVNGAKLTGVSEDGKLQVEADDKTYEVEKALLAVGRRNNADRVRLDRLDLNLSPTGLPEVDKNTMKVKQMPHLFIPGDVNGQLTILHEASDEGTIAGYNAVNDEQCFKRRTSFGVTFSDPNIAFVGKNYRDLQKENSSYVTGEVSFEGQGRSIVKLKEQGLLRVYAAKESGVILGAELHAPDGEHLAHLLAWAISMKLTVLEALRLPFYHPVIEEGLRTALRDCAVQLGHDSQKELFRCQDSPIR